MNICQWAEIEMGCENLPAWSKTMLEFNAASPTSPQESDRSWKTWKVMEFKNFIFQAWSWKAMENKVLQGSCTKKI